MAGRYARALFELAESSNVLDDVCSDLAILGRLLSESPDLDRLVKSPVFSADEQSRALLAVIDKVGITGLARNFAGLVAQNRRLFALADMIRGFNRLVAHSRGEVSADVVSARALSSDQEAQLMQALKDAMGCDVQIKPQIDETLLGGLIVKVGSQMIDGSLRTKLNKLHIAMKEVG